jgi:hypothetical protein
MGFKQKLALARASRHFVRISNESYIYKLSNTLLTVVHIDYMADYRSHVNSL